MDRYSFDTSFCSWIKILYPAPQASIRTNKTMSDFFSLSRGTRQGCPSSSQLFNVAIEPLAILLNTNNLARVQRAGHLHKALYADDLVLFHSNPCTTIPIARELITKFRKISGYRLNIMNHHHERESTSDGIP